MHRKGLVIGILILLIGVNIGSTFAGDVDVKSISSVGFDGNTLYVGGSGPNNYTTIQEAINDAVDGDTVFVFGGIYYENIDVYKTINLTGEDKNSTIIQGYGGVNRNVVDVKVSNVVIRGFTITKKPGEAPGIGIFINSNNNIIENNIIKNMYMDGIKVWGNKGNTISRNTITNCFFLIRLASGSHNNITDNILLYPCNVALHLMPTSRNNYIGGNHIYGGNRVHGISLWRAHSNIISRNNFIDCSIYQLYSYLNRWISNYYSDWNGRGPKIIIGYTLIPWFPFLGELKIPYLNFDWNPATEPYDIGV